MVVKWYGLTGSMNVCSHFSMCFGRAYPLKLNHPNLLEARDTRIDTLTLTSLLRYFSSFLSIHDSFYLVISLYFHFLNYKYLSPAPSLLCICVNLNS